ncbi:hypothetical protein D3C71_2004500 [compost metagenome]
MGVLSSMYAIAHTRHSAEREVRVKFCKLNHKLPVTRPSNSDITPPGLEKSISTNDGCRGRNVAVVNQKIRNLITPAKIICTTMPRVARPW